ncbi:GumC family protein [Catenovulum sediminis]|uniref:Polysaccharide biosynthesis tyrosine autokinase n=1 Tax=Catenovulum sediminis TaxID=1740262 RepID=A0ABV1RK19_9ALTE|nr:polysaccharide biosynthesis tyrosine autokinase [Catenovulum sediminis]
MTETTQRDDEIDLNQLFALLWRGKWFIVLSVVLFTACGYIYVQNAVKIYSATTSLQVGFDQGNVVSIDELYVMEARTKEHYNTQIEMLKSRNMLRRVVERLNLDNYKLNHYPRPPILTHLPQLAPWIYPPIAQSTNGDLAIQLQSMIQISQVASSQLISITVKAKDPDLAAQIANTLADVYMDFHNDSRQAVNDNAAEWLVTELERLKRKLSDAEAELQRFMENNNLVDLAGVLSLKAKDVETYAAQQLAAQKQIDELKVQYLAIQNVTDPMLLLSSSAIKPSALVESTQATLSQLKRKLAETALVYGPKHPKRKAVIEEIDTTERMLKEQVQSLLRGVEQKYLTAHENLEKIKSNFIVAKTDYQQLRKSQSSYRQLLREVEASQELYDTFLKRLQETKATKNMQKAFARILDYAIANHAPVSPKKALIVVLAFLLGGMLAVMLIFVVEFKRKGLRNAEEASQYTGLPVLTELPKVKCRRESTHQIEHDQLSQNSYYVEAMRTLRTRLKLQHADKKIIAVTSAMPGEGKSSIALHLAKAFSELEKVLVIDADLHKPSMASKLGLLITRPGLVELMSGQFKLASCLHRQKSLGYDVITAGTKCENPTKLLLSDDFAKLLRALAKHYDRVIVETAPVNLVSDAQAIVKAVDGIVYIARAEKTPRGLVKNGIDILAQMQATNLGMVLNQVNYKLSRYQYRQYINVPKPVVPVSDKVISLKPRYNKEELEEIKLKQKELLAQYNELQKNKKAPKMRPLLRKKG